ncbi:Protein SZT2 [Orchesella cincta]|uniref:Protein SZT2 n=1 Tax=Orchesella cincta TaxID=48709 RepID=A0A1D2MUZ5_ORCCI|nr:Protein SZT2 [Orchesella cincta]
MALENNGKDESMTRGEEVEEADDEAEEDEDEEGEDENVIRITTAAATDFVDMNRERAEEPELVIPQIQVQSQPLPSTSSATKKEEKSEREYVRLEAKEVYILMSKEYRISRNRRAEWFFNHVNSCLSFPPDEDEGEKGEEEEEKASGGGATSSSHSNGSSDFEVVSIIPLNPPQEWTFDNRHAYRYHVNPNTVVTYLSRRYRIVFCLDISPSIASVDVQAGGVVFDNIFKALQACLHGLLQPFEVPGSRRMFGPEIFITVIAHTPFFTPVTDQVLIQGQILDSQTCDKIIHLIFGRLNDIENKIASIVSNGFSDDDDPHIYYDDDEHGDDNLSTHQEEDHRVNLDETFLSNNVYSSLSMSPDFGLLDLLRQALIALSLMPENSSAGLVILTDGVISVPDGRYLDIILSQLRYNTVSCSFIQLSSPFHPHLCHGVLPYADLMKFIASATFGAYLSDAPDISDTGTIMNVYHMAFLAWSFQKTLETEWTKPGPPTHVKPGEWSVRNKCFFSVRDMPIVKKQQYENILNVDHMKVMSCRLREGFTIKEVVTSETGLSEVTLILPWKFLIHLEYKILISSDFDDEVGPAGSRVRCAVSLEGPYDFLHDVTCLAKKPFSSLYRQLMVNRFWATRKNLSESDRLLVHLNSFSSNPAYYNIPETLRKGMPLFYWAASSSATPQLHQSNELSIPQFTQFWKPVCLLDTTVWQKWMHTHRIGVILEHDYPLPKHMHLPNSTGRFNVIQCRQAVMALNNLLKSMSTFVLLENQSYVHLLFKDEEKVPYSFCLIRVTSKPPHVVLRLAFLVGTPGHLRHRTVATFREKIANLMFPQRVKDPPKWRVIMNTPSTTTASPLVNKTAWSEMPCCVIVQKPVEKILIRYDKRRFAIFTSYVEGKSAAPKQSTFGFRPTYQAPWGTASFQMLPEVFNTIARYLHHKRWIWWFPGGELPPLNMKWASEILATVTKIRLQEGFRFAYSSAGITNMVLELPMKNNSSNKNAVAPMVLQFVIFPPCSTLTSEFDDYDSFDAHDSLYLITECWAEPQYGQVAQNEPSPAVAPNFLELDYTEIPKQMFETDHKCISLVGTFEYLVRICDHKEAPFLISVNQSTADKPVVGECESIEVIPFEFDLKQILMRSGQVEILFSSFFQDLSLTFPNEWNQSVCHLFERANSVLYQQWCGSIASLQDKEVELTMEQHDAATRAVLQRKGIEEVTDTPRATPGTDREPYTQRDKHVQWRCFVRSTSTTHVILTLLPSTLKDVKSLLLQLENMESIHKTKCSRYVEFLESDQFPPPPEAVELSSGTESSILPPPPPPSLTSSQLSHSSLTCTNCQGGRKRVRAFSGGECAPAVKKYMTDTNSGSSQLHQHQESGSTVSSNLQVPPDFSGDPVRSQTFSEGTVSGKLAQFVRAKRAHSEQAAGTPSVEQEENPCCAQINYFLHRSGSGGGGGATGGSDDSLRYVPCRTPIIGSLGLSVFTYSCSLLSLTDHVIFKKLSRDEMVKDFRVNKGDTIGTNVQDEFEGDEDDDDDLSSGSGTIFHNGRSISQESFSESSLQ